MNPLIANLLLVGMVLGFGATTLLSIPTHEDTPTKLEHRRAIASDANGTTVGAFLTVVYDQVADVTVRSPNATIELRTDTARVLVPCTQGFAWVTFTTRGGSHSLATIPCPSDGPRHTTDDQDNVLDPTDDTRCESLAVEDTCLLG